MSIVKGWDGAVRVTKDRYEVAEVARLTEADMAKVARDGYIRSLYEAGFSGADIVRMAGPAMGLTSRQHVNRILRDMGVEPRPRGRPAHAV